MNISKRPVRNAHAAFFAPTGDRIYTSGDYLCGYALPALERLFRIRVRNRASIHACEDKLVLAYPDGFIEIRDGVSGRIRETLDLNTTIRHFAVSACGRFAAVSKHSDEFAVFELQSAKELWRHPKAVNQMEWLEAGLGFAVVTGEMKIEAWTWPPAQQPFWMLQLSGWIPKAKFSGSRVAIYSYPVIAVRDMSEGAELFTVTCQESSVPYWLRDGRLLVMRSGTCELYQADGTLTHKLLAPALSEYGNAFSPVRDDAVLSYLNGIVFIEGFQSLMSSQAELLVSFPPRVRQPARSDGVCSFPQALDEQVTIEATTPEELIRALERFKKPAWLPALLEERSGATSSKFGGVPWLSRDEQWPRCGQCGSYMNLFLQLNSDELPEGARGNFDGLLQVFVCTYETYCDGVCESFETFSNASLVRICNQAGPAAFCELPDAELYEEQHIVGWIPKWDLPRASHLRTLGVTLSVEQQNMLDDVNLDFPIAGDKLLGWPSWQQNVESHECRACHEAMTPIFQIDSGHGVPALLGDGGRGWIVQCPTHPHVVAFHWNC
jgi:hypothetical protein